MHITLIKIRKFTWRNERWVYIIIKKHMCKSVQKSCFVWSCVGPCASSYFAAAIFAMEFNSLLRNCALNTTFVTAQVTFKNTGGSLNKVGEFTYMPEEGDTLKVWAAAFALSGGLRLPQYCGCRTWHCSTVPHNLLLFCSLIPRILSSASYYLPQLSPHCRVNMIAAACCVVIMFCHCNMAAGKLNKQNATQEFQ